MKRRSFLALLGLAPAGAVAIAKAEAMPVGIDGHNDIARELMGEIAAKRAPQGYIFVNESGFYVMNDLGELVRV